MQKLKDENFELLKDEIEINDKIGGGQFGDIFDGFWINLKTNERVKVAIKTVKNAGDDNYKKFMAEALNFKRLQTHFIVRSYGCVLVRVPWIVMEFMEHSDL